MRARRIYLASSWRNDLQPTVLGVLRGLGHEVYDFKDEEFGFRWSEVDPNWKEWTLDEYLKCLLSPQAESGFRRDFEAMEWANTGVMLMPCGRSAHLEAGYFVGAGKPLYIAIPDLVGAEAELMYKMATAVCRVEDLPQVLA